MKHLKFLLPLLFLALTTSIAFAQDQSVVVERRDADITIHKEGGIDFIETWVVNFQGGPFHFATRTIPLEKISSLVFDGVAENGVAYTRATAPAPNTYMLVRQTDESTITWYFPPTTNGTRTFQLTYHVTDALRIYDGGDQFWWKFIEFDRGYPINGSRVTLHLPSTFDTNQLKAATYTNGNETGGATVTDGQTVEFTGGPFPSDTEWEIRAQFPHGIVTQSVQAWQTNEEQQAAAQAQQEQAVAQFKFYSTLTTLLLLVGGGLALLLLWYLGGRDRAVALGTEFLNAPPTDPVTNAPPLTPALAGTLIDEEANVRDVLASLIDWAQRGIIQIRAVPNAPALSLSKGDDYTYDKVGADAPPLQYQYERDLMQRLWQGERSRSIGYIREKFTESLHPMFDSLYDELVRLGYFPTRPDRVRAQFHRFGWLLLVLIVPAAFLFQIFVGNAYDSALAFSFTALAPWFVLFLLSAALMVLARFMPRKTPAGAQAAARWHAFRRYLENIEKYTNVADAKDQFEKYLPYAVAFGLDKTWVEKFAAVNTPAPTWYTPPSVTHTVTSTQSGSSTTVHPTTGSILSVGDTSNAAPRSTLPSAPSLNDAAGGAFTSLNNVSASFFSMLNSTATSFVASDPTLSPRSGSYRSGSSSSSSWSGGSGFHSSSSSFHSSGSSFHSSGGGGGGGGGHSGFG